MISAWTCSDDAELQRPPPHSSPPPAKERPLSVVQPAPQLCPSPRRAGNMSVSSLVQHDQTQTQFRSAGGRAGEGGVCVVAGVSLLPQPYPSWQWDRGRGEVRGGGRAPSPWWPAAVDRRMTVGWLMLASYSPGHPFHPLPSLPHPIIIIMGPISRRVMQMAPPNTKTQRRRQNTHRIKRTENA